MVNVWVCTIHIVRLMLVYELTPPFRRDDCYLLLWVKIMVQVSFTVGFWAVWVLYPSRVTIPIHPRNPQYKYYLYMQVSHAMYMHVVSVQRNLCISHIIGAAKY